MNPARSFAPAVFNGDWKDHWVNKSCDSVGQIDAILYFQVYWLGPMGSAVFGGFLYKYIFVKDPPANNESPEGVPLNDKA